MSHFNLSPVALRLMLSFSFWMALACLPHAAQATQWLSIKKTGYSQLMIDQQSLVEEKPYIKAWVKVEYLTPQKNVESVDRMYNNAKALWYFDCEKRKAATIQVFQYQDDELMYSAGTTAKQADFIEPLPESEVEVAQQYACKWQIKQKQQLEAQANRAAAPAKPVAAAAKTKENPAENPTAKTTANQPAEKAPATPADATAKAKEDAKTTVSAKNAPAKETKPSPADDKKADKHPSDKKSGEEKTDADKGKTDTDKAKADGDKSKTDADKGKTKTEKNQLKAWTYAGAEGPDKWASLNPGFASCGNGSQQSPIQIDNTIAAALKPIKRLHKFPLKSIQRKDHGLVLDAGGAAGNMMVLDQKPYQLKHISLHAPAEHQIKQKTFAAELQMVHEDKNGNLVIIAVTVDEGSANPVFEKLFSSLPKESEESKTLAMRVTPAELMPVKPGYYRYSGSLTTPPCNEGVQWIVMKEQLHLSKLQIQTLQKALGTSNQRPLQDVKGRMILE